MASFSAIGGVLAQRNARIFYSGSVVCWTGSWVQRIATDWLAWQMTHSTLWVGVIAFCSLVPSVVVSPIAGAVADRVDRVKLTMASQYVAMSQSIILVVLILTGTIRIEFMALLSFCNGAGGDLRTTGAAMSVAGPGAAEVSAGCGGAEQPDLQHRALCRTGDFRPDDRRLGRGAVDSRQRRGVFLRQRDDDSAAAGPGDPGGRPRRRLRAA